MSDQYQPQSATASSGAYDVAIIGAGIAGLTLALQIKKARPATSIVVIDKQKHPVPEAAHKVGESSVEIQAHYLRDVLGLGEHLQSQQLRKFGLRLFFTQGDNRDITRRVELGHSVQPPAGVGTYQIDRGRFENTLGQIIVERGVTFLDGQKVEKIMLEPENEFHRVKIEHDGGEQEIQARWIVDGTGRRSFLKRQLGLDKKNGHEANACWFRVGHPININDWSDDPEWLGRIRDGDRQLSTNHLMGEGYWIWLIRLASDSISIGIVSDARLHDFNEMNRLDRAMEWLHKHEPQCAEVIEQHRDKIWDFRTMKDYSYTCEQVFSADRWCMIGESGVALDPFYSPGGDLTAISNGLVTDAITRHLDGEDIEDRIAIHNQLFLLTANSWLGIYRDQYPIMGNAQIMIAKTIWDTAVYWAVPGLLYFHDQYNDFGDNPLIAMNLMRFSLMSEHVQKFFRDWYKIAPRDFSDMFISFYDFDFMAKLHIGMTAGLPDEELKAQFVKNVRFLEQLAGQLVSTVIASFADQMDREEVRKQVEEWQQDEALSALVAIYQEDDLINPVSSGWITLGNKGRVREEIPG